MRKGQFIFNFLRPYFSKGDHNNPYPNCHNVIFQISDENWSVIEEEYLKFHNNPTGYKFPEKPFGDSIISKEHETKMEESITELFQDMRNGVYDRS